MSRNGYIGSIKTIMIACLGAERSLKKAGDLVQLAAIINTSHLCN